MSLIGLIGVKLLDFCCSAVSVLFLQLSEYLVSFQYLRLKIQSMSI